MKRQGLGTRSWGLGIKGSWFRIGGSGFRTLLGLAILVLRSTTASAAAPGGGSEKELAITVRVYDYAHVGRRTLIAAEEQAAFIYRKVGVAMIWCNVPRGSAEKPMDSFCGQPAGRTGPKLRIVRRLTVVPGVITDSTMGFATGNVATVSYHWVAGADPSSFAMPADILAYIIAHEIGHLLLGPNSHSPTGIMMGGWTDEALLDAGQGRLLFTPQQGERIRVNVLARSGEPRTSIAQTLASQP